MSLHDPTGATAGLWSPGWPEPARPKQRRRAPPRRFGEPCSPTQIEALVELVVLGPMRRVPRGMVGPAGRIFMAETLRELEARGLVGVDPRGARGGLVSITAHGRALIERLRR